MGVTYDHASNPLGAPRRRRSLRRRVAELERLLAEVENDAAQALAEQRSEIARDRQWLRDLQMELERLRAWRAASVRFDHEPAVSRLLAGEPEAAMRRTGSPT